jgi:hypothetical protein
MDRHGSGGDADGGGGNSGDDSGDEGGESLRLSGDADAGRHALYCWEAASVHSILVESVEAQFAAVLGGPQRGERGEKSTEEAEEEQGDCDDSSLCEGTLVQLSALVEDLGLVQPCLLPCFPSAVDPTPFIFLCYHERVVAQLLHHSPRSWADVSATIAWLQVNEYRCVGSLTLLD